MGASERASEQGRRRREGASERARARGGRAASLRAEDDGGSRAHSPPTPRTALRHEGARCEGWGGRRRGVPGRPTQQARARSDEKQRAASQRNSETTAPSRRRRERASGRVRKRRLPGWDRSACAAGGRLHWLCWVLLACAGFCWRGRACVRERLGAGRGRRSDGGEASGADNKEARNMYSSVCQPARARRCFFLLLFFFLAVLRCVQSCTACLARPLAVRSLPMRCSRSSSAASSSSSSQHQYVPWRRRPSPITAPVLCQVGGRAGGRDRGRGRGSEGAAGET